MLAGAVALAAGRFQPLIRLEPGLWGLDDSGDGQAPRYERGPDAPPGMAVRASAREPRRGRDSAIMTRLGDDCDFLTIAGDWPYRYDDEVEGGTARGIQALDDLIGRNLEGEPDARGLNGARRRWAFTGRLLGDPAASVARAMGALFLAPDAALFWDTYSSGPPWSAYTAGPGGTRSASGRGSPRRGVFLGAGPGGRPGGLATGHGPVESVRPASGSILRGARPTSRSPGGPGRPADVPGGFPASVVMIHSYSAADPADPGTLAGRWLAQGAFVYFGSVNEPLLVAFRRPALVAELAAGGCPCRPHCDRGNPSRSDAPGG